MKLMNISSLLDQAATKWPNNTIIRYQNQNLTHQEAQTQCQALAQSLMQQGIKKGDVVAAYLLNNPQLAMLYLACFKVGAIVLPMSFRIPSNVLTHLVNQTKPKLIVTQNELLNKILTTEFEHQD